MKEEAEEESKNYEKLIIAIRKCLKLVFFARLFIFVNNRYFISFFLENVSIVWAALKVFFKHTREIDGDVFLQTLDVDFTDRSDGLSWLIFRFVEIKKNHTFF